MAPLPKFKSMPGVDPRAVIKNHARQRGITDEQATVELKALFGTAEPEKEKLGKAHFIGGGVDDASSRKGYGGDYAFNIASQYAPKSSSTPGSGLNFEC